MHFFPWKIEILLKYYENPLDDVRFKPRAINNLEYSSAREYIKH